MSKITPDGFSTTSETSLAIGGSEPRGIALDAAGNVYMPNFLSNNLTKITPDGTVTILTEIPSNQQAQPVGIAIDKAGSIYTANISVGSEGGVACGEVCYAARPGGITKTVDSSIATYPATGDTSPIRITGLTPRVPGGFGTEYLISLIAVSDAGESGMSNRVLVTPTAPIAPDAPTIDSIRPGAGQLTVAFTPGYDNGSPITSYTASCLRVVGSGRIRIDVVGSTSPIAVTSMYNGDTYECFVTATNIFGTGPASATSEPFVVGTVTISEPGAPQITNIEPGDAQVSISVSVADDGWSPITGYNAYCSGDRFLFGASPTSPIAVSGLTNGEEYTCAVTATNDIGDSPASSFSAPFTPVAPPAAPQITNIEPGNAQVSISVSVADDGGSPITGYNAYCLGDTFNFDASPTSPITVLGLTNGVSYVCAVSAENDLGTSTLSAVSAPFTPVAPAPGC